MRNEIRLIFTGLGTDFSTMNSGEQLYDVNQDYIVGVFVETKVSLLLLYRRNTSLLFVVENPIRQHGYKRCHKTHA